MQLRQYQKDLLLKLLNDHDDLLLQQLRLCKNNKTYEEHRKKSLEVTELIELIEKVPTEKDMLKYMEDLAERFKKEPFEERIKTYQEENKKAMRLVPVTIKYDEPPKETLTIDLNDIKNSGVYRYNPLLINKPTNTALLLHNPVLLGIKSCKDIAEDINKECESYVFEAKCKDK